MATVSIDLTEEQKATIKETTGMELDSLTVEKIDDDAASELDLNVEELEDRVNPAIETWNAPALEGGQFGSQRVQPGSLYLGVTSGKDLLLQANPRGL